MGLRERKKERTARAIEDAALRLFAERGFQATTVADIAEAADIAPRTFFSYFPSKESVLFGDFEEIFQSLSEHLESRTGDVLGALRAWVVDISEGEPLPGERDVQRRALIDGTEQLLAYERQQIARFEAVIAPAVAKDLDAGPDDLHPRIVAAAAAAALASLRPDPDSPGPAPAADPLAQVDEALAFLRGGMTALRRRRRAV
jgi:AcrR family transcriptional regulator